MLRPLLRRAARAPLAPLLVPALVAACGGSEPQPAAPSSPSSPEPSASPAPSASAAPGAAPASAAPAGPPTPWKDMTQEQRRAYMKSTVLPKMKALFEAQDPQ